MTAEIVDVANAMLSEDSPYDPGPCQRCGKPSEIILKIGEHVVKGEVVYAPDRRCASNVARSGSASIGRWRSDDRARQLPRP
jgi:hypothetical protein